MDVSGSEIGQKMRSAIKAKLTELGCYVDDELPDYVMVMVANKRTRAQMEDDLQLFLGENTELFVNWLHQVLKKLQEVTVTAPIKPVEQEKSRQKSLSKDPKSKEKQMKDKPKKSDGKKAKKKDKQKSSRKKDEKKEKNKKKSKHHDIIRPNIPPLLMNIEKESEPSITDIFAGQILKNHGITLDMPAEPIEIEKKTIVKEVKRPPVPIIDPATIQSQSQPIEATSDSNTQETERSSVSSSLIALPREDQIKEINEIEAKIQGLKQKLVEQLDSMSDDEDFLNIRTEAEELMNDFAEDVFQEISQQAPPVSPPKEPPRSPSLPPPLPLSKPAGIQKGTLKDPIETLPQIELKLPKRPIRDRLGVREQSKTVPEKKMRETRKTPESPERFTPEREPEFRLISKLAKKHLATQSESQKKHSASEKSSTDKSEVSKKLTSKVSVLENRPGRATCASVVRVRPRPRVQAPASSLLLRAVADAHKSLLNAPVKVDPEQNKVKRALVLPMRRCNDAQNIVIQVAGADAQRDADADEISLDPESDDEDKSSKMPSDTEKEEYVPISITKKIINNEYTPSRRKDGRTATKRDDKLIIETINIHNPIVDKDKNTQFIVTMEGYHPNAFLAKKMLNEGLLNDEEEINKMKNSKPEKDNPKSFKDSTEKPKENIPDKEKILESTSVCDPKSSAVEQSTINVQKKRLSDTSESDTQVIIKKEDESATEKRKHVDIDKESPPAKKRKSSPIVFDVGKKEKEKEQERVRERTESVSSDNQVVVTTTINTNKYDAIPPLSVAERKPLWCRAFPQCRYGAACAFLHPRCKFAAACTRRNCVYSHVPPALAAPVPPSVASHVVPAANYKSISTVTPSMCKYYPNCVNPTCHYYHPKPCRYGKSCANKLECNFYHADVPSKWRYLV